MSIQFGRWNINGQPVDRDYLGRAAVLAARYAPEKPRFHMRGQIGMLYCAFVSSSQPPQKVQPLVNATGIAVTWDGRLDNREDLLSKLAPKRCPEISDAEIALMSYERWSENCLSQLLGDWALALWDPIEQRLLLARDFAGVRQLFYSLELGRATWSTVLDSLLLLDGRSFRINEAFIAGALSTFPSAHLTPYCDVSAVAPGTYVSITRKGAVCQSYFRFDPSLRIRYSSDVQYEEHFCELFAQSVRRRLNSRFPVLAELSGGMDSTSIVCMADQILSTGDVCAPRLDTVSYYDDQEPNWDERPYFSIVERIRGRKGIQINVGENEGAFEPLAGGSFFPFPGYDRRAWMRVQQLARCLEAGQNHVLLSGIGGDEFLGGVPTPVPELQSLVTEFRWVRFLGQLIQWSRAKRRPLPHLFVDSMEAFLPQPIRKLYRRPLIPSWLSKDFIARNADTFWASLPHTQLCGPSPFYQSMVNNFDQLTRQLCVSHLNPVARYRVTFPYLDRDLLKFLMGLPPEQLVRPGERRSLMRRALAGLVPSQILARKRKAYLARGPLAALAASESTIGELLNSSLLVSYGWVDKGRFASSLAAARHGRAEHTVLLQAALKIELWLRSLASFGSVLREHEPSGTNSETPIGLLNSNPESKEIQSLKAEYSRTHYEGEKP